MGQTIIASLVLAIALLYVIKSCARVFRPSKKKGCGCCGCGGKKKDSSEEQVVSINK
jgi:hypothetical protein